MSEVQLSHVALLLPSVRKAADVLRKFDFQIGKEEEWDGEGTRETPKAWLLTSHGTN